MMHYPVHGPMSNLELIPTMEPTVEVNLDQSNDLNVPTICIRVGNPNGYTVAYLDIMQATHLHAALALAIAKMPVQSIAPLEH